MQLQIRHIGVSDNRMLFQVVKDGKHSPAVILTSPWDILIGTNQVAFRQELQWYLEEYLQLPVGLFNEKAEQVLAMLSKWGKECFDTLFNSGGHAQNWYHNAYQQRLSQLHIVIASDDPIVLSWPWEALE